MQVEDLQIGLLVHHGLHGLNQLPDVIQRHHLQYHLSVLPQLLVVTLVSFLCLADVLVVLSQPLPQLCDELGLVSLVSIVQIGPSNVAAFSQRLNFNQLRELVVECLLRLIKYFLGPLSSVGTDRYV